MRGAVAVTALTLVLLGGASCSSAPPPRLSVEAATPAPPPRSAASLTLPVSPLSEEQRVLHALNRLGYGPRPGDVDRVRRMGLSAYIEQQLTPTRIADPAVEQALSSYPVLGQSAAQLVREYPQVTQRVRQRLAQGEMTRQDVMEMYPPERRPAVITSQMQAAGITRAVLSERQLAEAMVGSWC